MYANAPHASAATSPSPHFPQGHAIGMPAAATHGGHYGTGTHAPTMLGASFAQQPAPAGARTSFATGAYQPCGDPAIDRMLQLEAALKRFGSPI